MTSQRVVARVLMRSQLTKATTMNIPIYIVVLHVLLIICWPYLICLISIVSHLVSDVKQKHLVTPKYQMAIPRLQVCVNMFHICLILSISCSCIFYIIFSGKPVTVRKCWMETGEDQGHWRDNRHPGKDWNGNSGSATPSFWWDTFIIFPKRWRRRTIEFLKTNELTWMKDYKIVKKARIELAPG